MQEFDKHHAQQSKETKGNDDDEIDEQLMMLNGNAVDQSRISNISERKTNMQNGGNQGKFGFLAANDKK